MSIRIRFNGDIIPQVIIREVAYESGQNDIVMMVVTRNSNPVMAKTSAHRFFFPHPLNLGEDRFYSEKYKSIFFHIGKRFDRYFTIGEIYNCKDMPTTVCEIDDHNFGIGCKNGDVVIVSLKADRENSKTHKEHVLRESSALFNKVFGLFQTRKAASVKSMTSEYFPFEDGEDFYLFVLSSDFKLRVWSVRRQMILITIPVYFDGENELDERMRVHKITTSKHRDFGFVLSIIISNGELTQCQIYDGEVQESGVLDLILKTTTCYPSPSPKDNQISSSSDGIRLWGLFNNGRSDDLLYTPIASDHEDDVSEMNSWNEVILHSHREPDIPTTTIDIAEAFLDAIFEPDLFSCDIISMTLCSFTNQSLEFDPADLTYANLRNIVRREVESLYASRTNAEDIYNIWRDFFRECTKIWEVNNDILGIFCPRDTDHFVFIVRKHNISVIRHSTPAESIAIMMSKNLQPSLSVPDLSRNGLHPKLVPIVKLLCYIEKELGQEFMYRFEDRLLKTYDPYVSCQADIESFLGKRFQSNTTDEKNSSLRYFIQSVIPMYKNMPNFLDCIEQVYCSLDLNDLNEDSNSELNSFNIYTSNIVDYMIVQGVRDILKSTYNVLRNLLIVSILRNILRPDLRLSRDEVHRNNKLQKKIRDSIIVVFALRWLSIQPISKSKFCHYNTFGTTLELKSENELLEEKHTYFLDLYYASIKKNLLTLLNNNPNTKNYLNRHMPEKTWTSLSHLMMSFFKLLDPSNTISIAHDILFTMINSNQYLTAQNYVRLLHQNSAYHEFVLAVCYLNTGEHLKAIESFIRVAGVYSSEESPQLDEIIANGFQAEVSVEKAYHYIEDLNLNNIESEGTKEEEAMETETSDSKASKYWKHIVSFIKPYKRSEVVVELSNMALSDDEATSETKQFFWANLFSHALACGQYDVAYMSIVLNPSREKQENCISHFVTDLCENGKLDLLLSYPFIGFQDHVDKLLESKAKKFRLSEVPNYYHILYSFNIKCKNYSRAAYAMYNCAQKEMKENEPSLNSLKHRCYLLLACINALKILDPQNAWVFVKKDITRVSSKRKFESTHDLRDFEEEELCDFEIKYLSDIEQLYLKTKAYYDAMLKHHTRSQQANTQMFINF